MKQREAETSRKNRKAYGKSRYRGHPQVTKVSITKSNKKLNGSNDPEIEFQMRKLFYSNLDTFNQHQWAREGLRWSELLFSLLSTINHRHRNTLRDIIGRLDDLELLEIDGLAGINTVNRNVDLKSLRARRIAEVLSECGFDEDELKSSILIMHEAAEKC